MKIEELLLVTGYKMMGRVTDFNRGQLAQTNRTGY